MSKKTSVGLSDFLSNTLGSRSKGGGDGYKLPDQPQKKIKEPTKEQEKKYYPTCVNFYQKDLTNISELQKFFFSKGHTHTIPKQSKIVRCSLLLASIIAKENSELLSSVFEKIEDGDAFKKGN